MNRIIGMYGFGPIQLDLMIKGFNICLKSRGIELSVEECWLTVIEREESCLSDRQLEIAAWALERAITLKGEGVICAESNQTVLGAQGCPVTAVSVKQH
jgi:hypothetical protein